jgi:hypothetical protein
MPDVFTKAECSKVMSRIRSRGNRDTELALARLLRAHRSAPPHPVTADNFPELRLAIQVRQDDGRP